MSGRELAWSESRSPNNNNRRSSDARKNNFLSRIINFFAKLCCCTKVASDQILDVRQPETNEAFPRQPSAAPCLPPGDERSRRGGVQSAECKNKIADKNKFQSDAAVFENRKQIGTGENLATRTQVVSKDTADNLTGATKRHNLPSVHKESPADSSDRLDVLHREGPKSAEFYREQARDHFNRKQVLKRKAKRLLKEGNRQLGNYYLQQVKEQEKLHEIANILAATTYLSENNKRHPNNTIDLHYLYVKEAIQALDVYLDKEIESLRNSGKESKSVMVITGRGKHSARGIPRIKPAVEDRLEERDLEYSEVNPGLLKVFIFNDSLTSVEVYK